METVYKQSEKNSKTENFRVAIKENYNRRKLPAGSSHFQPKTYRQGWGQRKSLERLFLFLFPT
ncbi:TPA: hypothetical protein VB881_001996 [Streptococcus suis]|nr:hypothetical protein [Streptococcus suis]